MWQTSNASMAVGAGKQFLGLGRPNQIKMNKYTRRRIPTSFRAFCLSLDAEVWYSSRQDPPRTRDERLSQTAGGRSGDRPHSQGAPVPVVPGPVRERMVGRAHLPEMQVPLGLARGP